jgi:glutamate 5-kinase
VLVTLEDSANRRRYLNSRATMEQLIGLGVVPIVNENDTVATDEIRYGDNDRLAAQIAVTVGADQLVLLSDVDGFYSANPKEDPEARRFETVDRITPEIEAMAGDPVSGLSKGGMKTKIMAAKTATGAAAPWRSRSASPTGRSGRWRTARPPPGSSPRPTRRSRASAGSVA